MFNLLRHPQYTIHVHQWQHTYFLRSDHYTLGNPSPGARLSLTNLDVHSNINLMDNLFLNPMDMATKPTLCHLMLECNTKDLWFSQLR